MRKLLKNEDGITLIGVMITLAVIGGMFTTYMMKNRNNRIQRSRESLFYGSNEIIPAVRAALEKDINGGKESESDNVLARCQNELNNSNYSWSLSESDVLYKLNPLENSSAVDKLKEYFPGFDLASCRAKSYDSFCFYSMRDEKIAMNSDMKYIGRESSFFGADFAFIHFMVKFSKGNSGKSIKCKDFNQVLVYTSEGYVDAEQCKDENNQIITSCIKAPNGNSRGIFQGRATVYYRMYVGISTGSGKKLVRSIKGMFGIGQTIEPDIEVEQRLTEEDEAEDEAAE